MSSSRSSAEQLGDLLQEFVNRVSHLQGNTLAVLTEEAVTLQQVLLLRRLKQLGESSPSELAAVMRMSLPAVSQMVDRLFTLGLVTRAEAPDDRRRKRVTITAKRRFTAGAHPQGARHRVHGGHRQTFAAGSRRVGQGAGEGSSGAARGGLLGRLQGFRGASSSRLRRATRANYSISRAPTMGALDIIAAPARVTCTCCSSFMPSDRPTAPI